MICIKGKYIQDVQSRLPTKDDIIETKRNIIKIGCPISYIVIDGKTYYGKFYYSIGFSNQIDYWSLDTNFYTFDHFVNKLKYNLKVHMHQNVVMLNDHSKSYYYFKLKYTS